MYKIRFIWVGKTQEDYLKLALQEYLGKLQPYVGVECLEIKPARYDQGQPAQWKTQETTSILKQLNAQETTFFLDERGRQQTSVEFAQQLEKLKAFQPSRVNFVIGGAFGLDHRLLERPQLLGLSAMTFTHQMVRLILVEQVYRAFTIMAGQGYHHS